jgi:hypothetical protein
MAAQADDKIDINHAKADQLMTLDGIGDVRAKAIIKGRPFQRDASSSILAPGSFSVLSMKYWVLGASLERSLSAWRFG